MTSPARLVLLLIAVVIAYGAFLFVAVPWAAS